jgi:hypothetical protein
VLTVLLAGQLMVGFWLSVTVTVKLQVAVFPSESVAVHVTVVVPFVKVEPEAGLQLVVTVAPEQVADAVGAG